MYIHLPAAEMTANAPVLVALAIAVGFVSGLAGVGGGFLMTPLLIFIGVPAIVAVGTQGVHLVATTVPRAYRHYQRQTIDMKLAMTLLTGGVLGSGIGVGLMRILRDAGLHETFIMLGYVAFLASAAGLLIAEWRYGATRADKTPAVAAAARRRSARHSWVQGLPFRLRYPRSRLYISVLAPLAIGAFFGLLAGLLGVGGGFLLVPALIYLLGVPAAVAVGTTLLQIVLIGATAAVLHATLLGSLDAVLAALLVVGGVIGAELGSFAVDRFKPAVLRLLIAALIIGFAARMVMLVVTPPGDVYSIAEPGGVR
jgi:uncharacterized membrane protein YfcA